MCWLATCDWSAGCYKNAEGGVCLYARSALGVWQMVYLQNSTTGGLTVLVPFRRMDILLAHSYAS